MFAKAYKNSDSSYIIIDGGDYLSGLKKINIFVGANNSGKSRFLRQIFKSSKDDFVFLHDAIFHNEKLKKIAGECQRYGSLFYMKDLNDLIKSPTGNYPSRFNEFYKKIETKKERNSGINGVYDLDVAIAIKNEMKNAGIYGEIDSPSFINRHHIYIPILRGVRHLDVQGGTKRDFYRERTDADYGIGSNLEIFSGLSIYDEIKNMLLGLDKEKALLREFEVFLSTSFFQGKKITLTSHHGGNLYIKIGDDEDREIHNVGDGIQSIIINTFQAFKYQHEDIALFLEEPEMMMHPFVQRVLIEKLVTGFENLQVFLTAHSNHFLDLTYDYPNEVAIFSFEEISKGKFKIKNIDDNARILDLLGIRNSSVFLSNCVIWTEGVTDRMFLRKLLEISSFSYKEDRHYSFAEYGGSNLENFDFIDIEESDGVSIRALTKKNYLIADNDNIKGDTKTSQENPKFIRRKKVESILGKNNFFDAHIEIENLIPYKVWINVIKRLLDDMPGKKIAPIKYNAGYEEKFNKGLKDKKIGVLMRKYLIQAQDGQNPPDYFKEDGITCLHSNKKKIMEYVIKVIDELHLSLDDFPQMTRELLGRIGEFVKVSNL